MRCQHATRTGLCDCTVDREANVVDANIEIRTDLLRIWRVMLECIHRGARTGGILPGGLEVRRRAAGMAASLPGGDPDGPGAGDPAAWLAGIRAANRDDEGYAQMGEVGSLAGNRSSFDVRNYGFKRLSDLFESLDEFKVERRDKTLYVKRLR